MFGHDNNQDLHTNDDQQNGDAAAAPTNDQQNGGYPSFMTPPADTSSPQPSTDLPAPDPMAGFTPPAVTDNAVIEPSTSNDTPSAAGAPEDLLSIKQGALQALTPLVTHLDQTPEEKFKTTMMMIQAADDQSLIKDAYAAAQAITDEKARAQALLDVVNEINYFTQHHNN